MRSMLHSAALIDAWLDTLRADQRETAEALRACVVAAEPGLAPSVKWGNLMFTLGGRHTIAIAIHKEHAHLQVFNGVALTADFPGLEGAGKGMRHLRVRYRQPIDGEVVSALVRASVERMAPVTGAGAPP